MSITIHPVSINQDDNINKLNKKFTDITLENEEITVQAPQVYDPKGSEAGTTTNGGDNSGKGGGSEESSGGGTFGDGRPKPDVGVGVFGLR